MNGQKNAIHICFICDEHFIVPTCTAIQSLIESKNNDTEYDIYIICASLSENSEKIFLKFEAETVRVHIIRENADKYSSLHTLKKDGMCVATTTDLLKFDLPELLNDLDKVLYLDGDLIVREDLSGLFETELGANMVAAAPDQGGFFGKIPTADQYPVYFNAGVMLLNLKQMRIENTTQQLVQTKKELTESSLMSQDVFNKIFDGRIVKLPIWYNFMGINIDRAKTRWTLEGLNDRFDLNCQSVEELYGSWKIMHYASVDKPWKNTKVRFAEEWYGVFQRSPVFNAKDVLDDQIKRAVGFVDAADAETPAGYDCVIPIVFASNENYAQFAGVAIQSILENVGPGRFYRVYVLHTDITDSTVKLLEEYSTAQLSVQCVNVDLILSVKKAIMHERAHYSKEMYYRFIIPEVFGFYSTVIYLDCDLIVKQDIADIIPDDMGDKLLAACRNITTTEQRKKQLTERFQLNVRDYFNSGVLIFNVKQWKAEDIEEKCFSLLKETPLEQLLCPDQDILNIACRNRVYYLDQAWNFIWHMIYGSAEQIKLCKDVAERIGDNFYILHFASGLKPWAVPELPHSRYFWEVARKSPFYEAILKSSILAFPEVTKQKEQIKELALYKSRIEELERENIEMSKTLINLHKSPSYRVGRGITWLPRKLRGGVRCYQEHGAAYTARRLMEHLTGRA